MNYSATSGGRAKDNIPTHVPLITCCSFGISMISMRSGSRCLKLVQPKAGPHRPGH
jgi:hypothetical protein